MLIYRSPTVILGDFEWHLSVSNRGGRITRQFYFRPLSAIRFQWQPMPKWRTRLPAGFGDKFQTYRLHAIRAEYAERTRAEAVLARERSKRPNCNACNGFCHCRAAKNNSPNTSIIC